MARGEYEWLWLYFNEVVWPCAEKVQAHVDRVSELHLTQAWTPAVHEIDGGMSVEEVASRTGEFVNLSGFEL